MIFKQLIINSIKQDKALQKHWEFMHSNLYRINWSKRKKHITQIAVWVMLHINPTSATLLFFERIALLSRNSYTQHAYFHGYTCSVIGKMTKDFFDYDWPFPRGGGAVVVPLIIFLALMVYILSIYN